MKIAGKKIHGVRLIFREKDDGYKIVRVTVRELKRGKPLIDDIFPVSGNVCDNDPRCWELYQGQRISVYHRREKKDRYEYVNSQTNSTISTDRGQRLETLVLKILKQNSE